MKIRTKWIDISKGIGAMLVLFGHVVRNDKIASIIYAFHMPLFFLLSGVTFYLKQESLFLFLKEKIKRIFIPYLIFSIPLFVIAGIRFLNNKIGMTLLIKRAVGIILCWKTTDYYNGVWFLPCVLGVYLVAYLVIKHIHDKRMIFCVSIAFLCIGFTLDYYDITLPWGFDTALVAFFFFSIGYSFKETIYRIKGWYIVFYIPTILIAYGNYRLFGKRIEMYSNDYGNYILFLISGLLGIIATIGISKIKLFSNNKVLLEIGKESLYLYGAQLFFVNIYNALINRFEFGAFSLVIEVVMPFLILTVLWIIKPLYYYVYTRLS